jgi:hypothetical protein
MSTEYWHNNDGKIKVFREKKNSVPALLCPSHIPNGLAWD